MDDLRLRTRRVDLMREPRARHLPAAADPTPPAAAPSGATALTH